MKKENIFILKDNKVFIPSADTYNRDITEVLEGTMEVPKRPQEVENAIRSFKSAILKGDEDNAKVHIETLKQLLSSEDPFWVTAEHLMSRMERNK